MKNKLILGVYMKEENKMEERNKMLQDFFSSSEYKPMRFRDIVAILQVPKYKKNELKEVRQGYFREHRRDLAS